MPNKSHMATDVRLRLCPGGAMAAPLGPGASNRKKRTFPRPQPARAHARFRLIDPARAARRNRRKVPMGTEPFLTEGVERERPVQKLTGSRRVFQPEHAP